MKPWIKPEEVRQRIPKGCELPARFDAFVRAEPPFRVEWNDLDSYSLKPTAVEEAVPFLRLPDGGLVAFWFWSPTPAVVHIGGHGELAVIASSFDDFLKAIVAKCSGLPDFDESQELFRIPGVSGKPEAERLAALQTRFEEWFKKHTSLLEPLNTPEAEALRQRVYGIAEEMIRDGRSKVYTLSATWWSMDYQIERKGVEVTITYLDYGKWYPVPESYQLVEIVLALLELVQDRTRSRYELSVHCFGCVSIDRDRQLLLVPPKPPSKRTVTQLAE